jgi:hypothetical protein
VVTARRSTASLGSAPSVAGSTGLAVGSGVAVTGAQPDAMSREGTVSLAKPRGRKAPSPRVTVESSDPRSTTRRGLPAGTTPTT